MELHFSLKGAILLFVTIKEAIATLPFIIPEDAMLRFPFEIAAGALVFAAAAFAASRERRIVLRVKKILRPQN